MSDKSTADAGLDAAVGVVRAARAVGAIPAVETFFDEATNTATHVVWDLQSRRAAVVDPVLDYDPAGGRTSTVSADRVVAHVGNERLAVDWLLETHVHADHLSAAQYLKRRLGGRLAISREVVRVQSVFGDLFNAGPAFPRDGSAFDHLFDDGERFTLGRLDAIALHAPGHTPADTAFVIGDAAFVGDTIFMPDWGTARADFPGGDARRLYRSICRLLSLPDETRLFLCHDYKPRDRDVYLWETTVGAERAGNVHVRDGIDEDNFVAMRVARDATLPPPRLILPSLQVNMRGGRLPEPEANGRRYLKIPVDAI